MSISDWLQDFLKTLEILINPPPLPKDWPEISVVVSEAFNLFRENMMKQVQEMLKSVEQKPSEQNSSITDTPMKIEDNGNVATPDNQSIVQQPLETDDKVLLDVVVTEKGEYKKVYEEGFEDGYAKCLLDLKAVPPPPTCIQTNEDEDWLENELADELQPKRSKIPRLGTEEPIVPPENAGVPPVLFCDIELFGHSISYSTRGNFGLKWNQLTFSMPMSTGKSQYTQRAKMEGDTVSFEVETDGTYVKILPREGTQWNDFEVQNDGQLVIIVPE